METTTSSPLNIFERINQWIRESIMVKLLSIGILILFLLIPSTWIESLMHERQSRAEGVMQEVSSKWSGSQTLSGPILVIPFREIKKIDRGKDGIEIQESVRKLFTLPETLAISGEVNPTVLQRGIFDAAVYTSSLRIKAEFAKPDFARLEIPENMILWKDAYMIFAITDLRGINENPTFVVGELPKPTEPSNDLGFLSENIKDVPSPDGAVFSSNGIIARLGWTSMNDFNGITAIKIKLKGSSRLNFSPTGKTTSVELKGSWDTPSFEGEFLPESRTIAENFFSAKWNVLHYNRPFAQHWTDNGIKLSGADFGVKLIVPVDQYQKSIRTSKYSQLIIILTFVALFFVEITQKIRIHPIQYILIGAALIIYYTLLLSFSERLGYDFAYWISTSVTVALVSFYSRSFLRNQKLVAMFTLLLVIFYSFIFIIVIQQDYALLLGSIGLFLIIAALMYFSRKIKWYSEVIK